MRLGQPAEPSTTEVSPLCLVRSLAVLVGLLTFALAACGSSTTTVMRSSPPDTGRTIAVPTTRTVTVVVPTVIVPAHTSPELELPRAREHDKKEKKSRD
jgi:hypothetical protein